MVYFIKHIDIEGPETIGAYFADKGYALRELALYAGDLLPEDFSTIDAIVSLGGPMNVYEEEKFPFLKDENQFIANILDRSVPFLGICLGSQLLAKACGSSVEKSPEKEIGFFPVRLTEAGAGDPLFDGLPDTLEVYQWHEDMSQLPAGAALLAESPGCPHQAFRIGPAAYGIQFHFEITDRSIMDWSDRYRAREPAFAEKKSLMLQDYENKKESFERTAHRIYDNFERIIQKRHVQ